jgi:hypothetical protein
MNTAPLMVGVELDSLCMITMVETKSARRFLSLIAISEPRKVEAATMIVNANSRMSIVTKDGVLLILQFMQRTNALRNQVQINQVVMKVMILTTRVLARKDLSPIVVLRL